MKIKLIGCQSTKNEVEWIGSKVTADCECLDYTYHAVPTKLHTKVQEIINASQEYDLIMITFSRCSNALLGIVSPHVPMVFPKTHDCIGLLLGSTERHLAIQKADPATYYFSQGWLDYGRDPYAEYLEYEVKYGEDKARMIIREMYGHYHKALLIRTPGMRDIDAYRQRVRMIADFFSWEVEELDGDIGLLQALLNGQRYGEITYVEPGIPITTDLYTD